MVAKAEVDVPRVVFDTNVILSALLFGSGRVGWIVHSWKCARVIPLVSKETARDLIRVLAYPKFRLTSQEQRTVLEAFLPYAETVRTRNTTSGPQCRDRHDQKFLQLAAQGHADLLVTGDEDLLSVCGFMACPIISPDQFKQMQEG